MERRNQKERRKIHDEHDVKDEVKKSERRVGKENEDPDKTSDINVKTPNVRGRTREPQISRRSRGIKVSKDVPEEVITPPEPKSEPVVEPAIISSSDSSIDSSTDSTTVTPAPAPVSGLDEPLPSPSDEKIKKLPVIILRHSEIKSTKIRNLFKDDYFSITEYPLDTSNINSSYLGALKLSKDLNPNSGVILVKEDTTSHTSSSDIYEKVYNLSSNDSIDLLYLCRHGDTCSKNSKFSDSIKNITGPKGLQCIMYTPGGRDRILGDLELRNGGKKFIATSDLETSLRQAISNKHLVITGFTPNLVNYDIDYATSKSDYNNLKECEDEVNTSSSNDSTTWNNLWWILIIVAVIFLIIIFALFYASRSSRD